MLKDRFVFTFVLSLVGLIPSLLVQANEKHTSAPSNIFRSFMSSRIDSVIGKDTTTNMDDSVQAALLNNGVSFFAGAEHSRALLHFYRSVNQKHFSRYKKRRLYQSLSRIFVRLKLYALAMNCFLKTTATDPASIAVDPIDSIKESEDLSDTASPPYAASDGSDSIIAPLPDPSIDDSSQLFNAKLFGKIGSQPIEPEQITNPFKDGEKALAYAIIIHIKQPAPGKRSAFTGINNVGHTFITLIKYNENGNSVTRSFGFYPQKDNLLSATPLHPESSSVFKDDAYHEWDEVIGKFISHKRVVKILRLIQKYDGREYNLNENNCTDFGLHVADIAGIRINGTWGNWFMGSGNNPANAGQSILEGAYKNTDTGNNEGLFTCPAGPGFQ